MSETRLHSLYRPNHDENARQAFVGELKKQVNGNMEAELEVLYLEKILPAFRAEHKRAPENRAEAKSWFESEYLYQLWGSAVYTSQDLLWETVGDTVDRIIDDAEEVAAALEAKPNKYGSLRLNPALELPEPIGSTEIHRQPGGYFHGNAKAELSAAFLYYGTIALYTAAKGFSDGKPVSDTGSGHAMAGLIRARYPDLKPTKILDLGCGTGNLTRGLKEVWPDAEVHGLDLSASFVRYGHVMTEDHGLEMHFHQLDAADTGFDDGSYDLIVSQIMFHETWHDKLPAIMNEVARLLAPDGLFFNIDVPYQPDQISIAKQVSNDWQVTNNGEPFWTGFVDTNIDDALANAGFSEQERFTDYQAAGGNRSYYLFGARKDNG